jgi:hypothetical protein
VIERPSRWRAPDSEKRPAFFCRRTFKAKAYALKAEEMLSWLAEDDKDLRLLTQCNADGNILGVRDVLALSSGLKLVRMFIEQDIVVRKLASNSVHF